MGAQGPPFKKLFQRPPCPRGDLDVGVWEGLFSADFQEKSSHPRGHPYSKQRALSALSRVPGAARVRCPTAQEPLDGSVQPETEPAEGQGTPQKAGCTVLSRGRLLEGETSGTRNQHPTSFPDRLPVMRAARKGAGTRTRDTCQLRNEGAKGGPDGRKEGRRSLGGSNVHNDRGWHLSQTLPLSSARQVALLQPLPQS